MQRRSRLLGGDAPGGSQYSARPGMRECRRAYPDRERIEAMDNIAHTLAGLALLRSGLGRRTRFAGAALVVGSNIPDADLVTLAGGRLAFIDAHRGLSHSLLGGCVLGVLLGAGLWVMGRLWKPGGGRDSGETETARAA